MAPKRSSSLKIMSAVKKARRFINLETKLDIIRRSERGLSGAAIARALGLRDSTVRTILKNGERIKRIYDERMFAKGNDGERKIQILTIRRPIISKAVSLEIENTLSTWYAKEIQNGNVIDFEEFKSKALSIYKEITKDYTNSGLYAINREVYEFCKRRFSTVSDTSSEAASADTEEINSVATNFCEVISDNNAYDLQTANAFSQNFHDIVEEGGYTPLQIFTVNETHLFWKRLPIKEITEKLETNDSIDYVTLLLGCNASGDFKLKPLLVNFIENPKALTGYPKDKLPVMWKTNKKASITQLIFSDWFTSYFCPAVEQYCIKNNLDNKALLVINNSPAYPTSLDDLSANVKVLFLPSKASSLLQPLDETFMKTFKANYHYKVLSQALIEIENSKPDEILFENLWKSYDIRKAINNVIEAWNDLSPSMMNKLWRQLFPNYVTDFSGYEDDIERLHEILSEFVKELGLEDINMEYFQKELSFDVDKINNELKLQLISHKNLEDFENNDDVIQIKSLSVSMLGEAMKNLENAMAIINENDPDSERSSNVCYTIKKAISSYRQLYRDKKKATELSVDKYLRNQPKATNSSECSATLEVQSTNSNEPQPSNIPLDIKLEFSPAESPSSDI